MAPRKYRLELSNTPKNWCARLILLPDFPAPNSALDFPEPALNLALESSAFERPALEWAEFDSPLALLEWLEKDLPLDSGFTGLR